MDPATRRLLNNLMAQQAKSKDARIVVPRRIKSGAVLVRVWKDRSHRVMVLEDGFAYAGKTYAEPLRDRPSDHRRPLERATASSACGPTGGSPTNETHRPIKGRGRQDAALRDLHPQIHRARTGIGVHSLDAQREACEAYIKSQASEGWVCLDEAI